MSKYEEFRNKYKNFYYHGYKIEDQDDFIFVTYDFEIEGLMCFNPTLKVPKKKDVKYDQELLNNIVFSAGLAEIPSYWKPTCSPNIIIECGFLDEKQTLWLKKLIFNGLGEFFYVNNIDVNYDSFVDIKSYGSFNKIVDEKTYDGYLIAVGGGKDSIASLEILKSETNKKAFIIGKRKICMDSALISGLKEDEILNIERTYDKKILELNSKGFLNGHTPISSCIAFISFLTAYLNDFKYVVLSNESSANESSVIGKDINHQYSKSFEFEEDFRFFTKNYLTDKIEYFSLLRPLSEIQIMKIFANYPKYYNHFISCNKGGTRANITKGKDGWCCSCAKCLFIYILMSNFISQDEMEEIFGENLLEKEELLETFLELLGKKDTKPFDCVGTIEEVNYSVNNLIKNGVNTYLTRYYATNYKVIEPDKNLLSNLNAHNNVPANLMDLLIKELKNDSKNNTKHK